MVAGFTPILALWYEINSKDFPLFGSVTDLLKRRGSPKAIESAVVFHLDQ